MTEQTASTDNTDPNQEPVEEPTAQDDLDALLNEYKEPDPPKTPEPAPIAPDEMAEFRSYMAETRADKINAGLQESAKQVKEAAGEVASNIPEWLFVGALRDEAVRNPAVEKIFNERSQNPEAWSKIATALGKKISQDLTPTDQQSTDSWNAVDSAVHSSQSSTSQPEAPKNLDKMNDMEFAAYKRGLG